MAVLAGWSWHELIALWRYLEVIYEIPALGGGYEILLDSGIESAKQFLGLELQNMFRAF